MPQSLFSSFHQTKKSSSRMLSGTPVKYQHVCADHSCVLFVFSAQGSLCFLVGFLMVVWGWAIVGFVVETYGFFLLFSGEDPHHPLYGSPM